MSDGEADIQGVPATALINIIEGARILRELKFSGFRSCFLKFFSAMKSFVKLSKSEPEPK